MTKGVLFDVDGTLVDSNYEHVVAWARAFTEAGQPGVSSASIHRAIGLPSDSLVTHLTGAPDDEVADRHDELLHEASEHITATPGAAELLQKCRGAGRTVVLVTSGKEADLDWMLPLIGGRDAVDAIVTSDDINEGKPDPDPFEAGAKKAGLELADCVIVGDSVWDMKAAARVDVPAIGVGCGGVDAESLRKAGAVEVYDDPADLADKLSRSLIGRS
ncbi:HAD family hydrolase [Blastococcus sp. Marseille-P5729]|uniref:HAD family hydrolase n=1 Tax=Blastococcus sp. Marseille-P5729 TaxID=2086582 RepID=UPI00131BD770|nr:HAD family hydrolase [Blastococcus sp. Marseille-P5729]